MNLLYTDNPATDPSFWTHMIDQQGLPLTILFGIAVFSCAFLWVVVRPLLTRWVNHSIKFLSSLTHKLDRIEDTTDDISEKVASIHKKVVGS